MLVSYFLDWVRHKRAPTNPQKGSLSVFATASSKKSCKTVLRGFQRRSCFSWETRALPSAPRSLQTWKHGAWEKNGTHAAHLNRAKRHIFTPVPVCKNTIMVQLAAYAIRMHSHKGKNFRDFNIFNMSRWECTFGVRYLQMVKILERHILNFLYHYR